KRADLIETRGESNEPVPRDAAVRRLEADEIAERGRLANRTAGVAAHTDRRFAGGHRRGRTAARTARDAGEVVRVLRNAERRVLARTAHRELIHVRFADRHATGVEQTLHGSRGVRGYPLLENLAAGGR